MVLLKDDGSKGTVIGRNDNRSRRDTDALLAGVFLQEGEYTIEATTARPGIAGSYDIDIEAVVTGLEDSYDATVGAARAITFRYWPPQAQVAVKAAAAEEFGLTVTAADGVATITLTPQLVHTHKDLTVRVSHPTVTERRLGPVTLTAKCPALVPAVPNGPTLTTSPHNRVLCIKTGTSDPAPTNNGNTVGLYHVTPGTLNGVLESATAAIAARPDMATCGLTPNKLAALMLSIGFRETPYVDLIDLRPSPARTPMSLGRADTNKNPNLHSDREKRKKLQDDNKRLYSRNDPLIGPARAFFHAGVGLWHLDGAGDPADGWVGLNHGQRANTGLGGNGEFDAHSADNPADSGGEIVAALLAREYCRGTDAEDRLDKVETYMDRHWLACRSGCMSQEFARMYLDNTHDLYVTIADNAGEYSTSGGVAKHRCRWDDGSGRGPAADTFECFFYDTTQPEGRMPSNTPTENRSIRGPLAAPFISFTHVDEGVQKRFAVFPGAILTQLKPAGDPDHQTYVKAVPKNKNPRNADYDWTTMTAGGTVLQMEICEEPEWVTVAAARTCSWVSVVDDDFDVRAAIKTD